MSVSQRSKRLKRSETRAIKAQGLKGLIRYGDRETVETAAGSVDTASWCVSVAGITPGGCVAASRWWAVADGHGGLTMRGFSDTHSKKESQIARSEMAFSYACSGAYAKKTVLSCAYLLSPLAPLFPHIRRWASCDGYDRRMPCNAASSWVVTSNHSRITWTFRTFGTCGCLTLSDFFVPLSSGKMLASARKTKPSATL